VLVDTSVWIDHFRRRNARLVEQLEAAQVWTHPFVIGEIACGNLGRRSQILGLLAALPQAPLVSHDEVLSFLDRQRLQGKGLGWMDMHLLASARLAQIPFWTHDKNLAAVAGHLDLEPSAH
jgi:predicted nucleic acid-binding protein